MNRKDLYNKTVNLLLDAYNQEKLRHNVCTACAVGNICNGDDDWSYVFYTVNEKDYLHDDTVVYKQSLTLTGDNDYETSGIEKGLLCIKNTGYSLKELMKIEWAFETAIPSNMRNFYVHTSSEKQSKEGQYMGLCAVLDVLKEIHKAPQKAHTNNQINLKSVYEKFKTEIHEETTI